MQDSIFGIVPTWKYFNETMHDKNTIINIASNHDLDIHVAEKVKYCNGAGFPRSGLEITIA